MSIISKGTTAVACINTNRNFIGIELDEGYFNIAEKRIRDTQENRDERIRDNIGKGCS